VKDSSINGVCTDHFCDTVRLGNPPPPPPACDAHFTFKPGNIPNSVVFFAAKNPPASTYSWDFGDGKTGSGPNPVHQFDTTNTTYIICLTVSDSAGTCSNTWCDTLHLKSCQHPPMPPVCTARFKFYPVWGSPGKLQFRTFPQPPGTTYYWDFGNGDTSTAAAPVEQFDTTVNAYNVCLTVSRTSPDTCNTTWCDSIHTRPPHHHLAQDPNIQVKIYPNPVTTNSTIHIDGCTQKVTLTIYDNMGRVVQQMTDVNNGDYQLNIPETNKGLHYYNIMQNGAVVNQGKFLKSDSE
jgi:PKD repeat protein